MPSTEHITEPDVELTWTDSGWAFPWVYDAIEDPQLCEDEPVWIPGGRLDLQDLAAKMPGDKFFLGDRLVTVTGRRSLEQDLSRFQVVLPDDCLTVVAT